MSKRSRVKHLAPTTLLREIVKGKDLIYFESLKQLWPSILGSEKG